MSISHQVVLTPVQASAPLNLNHTGTLLPDVVITFHWRSSTILTVFSNLQTMARTFLQRFPCEILDKIFRKLLAPTGLIMLSERYPESSREPTNFDIVALDKLRDQVIRLGVLRTCKQVYQECKDVIWKYNTLHIIL